MALLRWSLPLLAVLAARPFDTAAVHIPAAVVVISVADAQSGAPLADAEVRLPGLRRAARTDWLGEARFDRVAEGTHAVEVRRVGYAPATLTLVVRGDTAGAVFMLGPAPASATALDTVRIRAAMPRPWTQEFETRRRMGIGRFLTDTVLAKEKEHLKLPFVLANNLPGLVAVPDAARMGRYILVSRRAAIVTSFSGRGSGGLCGVDVYLDGTQYRDDLDGIDPRTLGAVEHYAMTAAPPQYRRSTGSCHVVLLWTR
ncbi:MAG TPA: carboxypeptidase regulatory-like domain-containing protein [Gemmatimonadaceae bacterium]|nr:carboxypeptidase regulatory-like domain-containing protein [Gemmatimonadaceae bacterium]